jgi:hypothetical protein
LKFKDYISNLRLNAYGRNQKRIINKQIRKLIKLANNKKKNNFVITNLALASKLNIAKAYPLKFKKFSLFLSKIFNKPVEFELTRIFKPHLDSTILASLISLIVDKEKKIKYRNIAQKIYKFARLLPINSTKFTRARRQKIAFLSGLNIKVAGRLRGERVIPRKTVQAKITGISAPGKVNFLDVAKLTKKNRKGAFTITVTTGQNLF